MRNLFINLPVGDVARTRTFWESLGFLFNDVFSNEVSACMVINDHSYAMFLSEDFFQSFTLKEMVDGHHSVQVIHGFSAASREEVDFMVQTAVALGAKETQQVQEHGYMYGRGFSDLDGHIWEIIWMDVDAAQDELTK
jgi:predicted lactoylglutathione lyase